MAHPCSLGASQAPGPRSCCGLLAQGPLPRHVSRWKLRLCFPAKCPETGAGGSLWGGCACAPHAPSLGLRVESKGLAVLFLSPGCFLEVLLTPMKRLQRSTSSSRLSQTFLQRKVATGYLRHPILAGHAQCKGQASGGRDQPVTPHLWTASRGSPRRMWSKRKGFRSAHACGSERDAFCSW